MILFLDYLIKVKNAVAYLFEKRKLMYTPTIEDYANTTMYLFYKECIDNKETVKIEIWRISSCYQIYLKKDEFEELVQTLDLIIVNRWITIEKSISSFRKGCTKRWIYILFVRSEIYSYLLIELLQTVNLLYHGMKHNNVYIMEVLGK